MPRTGVKNLLCKLADDADSSTYILAEPRVGYRMAKGGDAETRACVAELKSRGRVTMTFLALLGPVTPQYFSQGPR